jgi:hypothetical protein
MTFAPFCKKELFIPTSAVGMAAVYRHVRPVTPALNFHATQYVFMTYASSPHRRTSDLGGESGLLSGGINVRSHAVMSKLASASPSGPTAWSRNYATRCAVAVVVIGATSATLACTSSAAKHEPGPAGSSAAATGTATAGPRPATTPVKPPSSGDVNHTVAVGTASSRAAVSFPATGDFGGGVTVHVTQVTAATTQARGPGEVSGPGLVFTLELANASAKAIDLSNVVVSLLDSTKAPASPISGSPARPFAGRIPAGDHATGVYVFTIPKAHRRSVTLNVSYTTEAPVVVFVGSAP